MNTEESSVLLKDSVIATAKRVVEQRRMVGDPRFARTNKNMEFKATYVSLAVKAWSMPQPAAESFARDVVASTIRCEDDGSSVARRATEVATAAVTEQAKALAESVVRRVLVRDAAGRPTIEVVVVGPELHILGNAEAARHVVKLSKAVGAELTAVATADPSDMHLTRRCDTYSDACGLLQMLEHCYLEPYYNEPPI